MSPRRKFLVAFLLGLIFAFSTGIIVLELNKIFYPEMTESWRLIAWTLGIGAVSAFYIYDYVDGILKKFTGRKHDISKSR